MHYSFCLTRIHSSWRLSFPVRAGQKLLMALTLSTDAALRFHYESPGDRGADKGSGKGKDIPSGRTSDLGGLGGLLREGLGFRGFRVWGLGRV